MMLYFRKDLKHIPNGFSMFLPYKNSFKIEKSKLIRIFGKSANMSVAKSGS